MQLLRDLPAAADKPLALTVGNFDGVHLGHQAMLRRLTQAAAERGLAPAVLTFEPNPREYFARLGRGEAPARLSTWRDKLECFRAHGVARTYLLRFNAALAGLTAEDFIDDVLVRRLGAKWLLIGDDFRFGRGRTGDRQMLERCAEAGGYTLEAFDSVVVGGERVSSSGVRDALANGDLERAARLLGRPYALSGRVAHGDKIGRNLGFPTANLVLKRKPALTGICAVRVHGLGPEPVNGVCSLGVRPTIRAGNQPLLETYLFNFDRVIYGARITVEFLHKFRDEAKFPDLESLTRQIERDVADARAYFAQLS